MKPRIKFFTLGCKTNQYDTQAIRETLKRSNAFKEADTSSTAELYVINTCTVTAKADKDSRNIIRRCHRENPDAEILVTGCLTEMDGKSIREIPGVTHIIKNKDKYKIDKILTPGKPSTKESNCSTMGFSIMGISSFEGHSRAFVKIQDGCDNFCSYCKVPLVRGRSRSRSKLDIMNEVERLVGNGFRELVLTGICLGSWGRDLKGSDLSSLIESISSIPGDFRIRLSSIEPFMISNDLIDTIARCDKVCQHLHIPLQSGSDRILKKMNRPYSGRDYIALTKKLRKKIKDLAITSDVMVGFPYEEEEDFKATLRVIKTAMPSRLHIFTYSKRAFTESAHYKDQKDPILIKRRRERLDLLARKLSLKYKRRFLGRKVQGLVETKRDKDSGLLTGYTDRYIRFLLNGPDSYMGKLISLRAANLDKKSNFLVTYPA